MIPFNRPSFGTEEEEALLRVLRSGHLTAGKEVEAFEKEFAEYLGAPYVIAVDSCTSALFLALEYFAAPVVRIPAMTFASVGHSVLQTGHELEFCDEYHAGDAYNLIGTNIWDCAHRIERGFYKPGQIQCFSFYPNKVLSSAEGGAIATDNREFAEWATLARQMGRERRSFSDYDIKLVGWKMNMTDIQAALARTQLRKLDSMLQRRYEIAEQYRQHFPQLNTWHYLYVIEVVNRADFMQKMQDAGVEVSYHYKPLYEHPAFLPQKLLLPETERWKDSILSLPLYPSMTDEEVNQVINLTKQFND